MTTAYTSLLGLALPVTGELSGTWGDVVNNSITSLLDSAIAGTTNVSTDADVTLTTTTGAANTAREAILLFSGARTALRTVTAPAQSKIYTVINATTGGYAVKLVGSGPTTGVTIANGSSTTVAWNGSDFVEVSSPSSIILPNGTANGVLYLNGSKVVTSGSALTFDGSILKSQYLNVQDFASSNDFVLGFRTNAGSQVGYVGVISSANNLTMNSSNSIVFNASSSEAMRLTSTGLGIGTSSPSAKLEVNGSLTTSADASALTTFGRFSSGYAWSLIRPSSTATGIEFRTNAGDALYQLDQSSGANKHLWYTGASERMRLDSSGNLGLGVTPSAWGGGRRAFQFGATGSLDAGQSDASLLELSSNWYVDGSGISRYLQSSFASQYRQQSGQHIWYNAASGTAGNSFSFTQAMTLSSGGNLSVGTTTSSGARIDVYNSGSGDATIRIGNAQNSLTLDIGKQGATAYGANGAADSFIYSTSPISIMSDSGSGAIKFSAGGNTERARIDSSGNLLVGTTSAGAKLMVDGSASSSSRVANFRSRTTGDTSYSCGLFSKNTNDSTTSQVFIQFSINNDSTTSGQINANGANQAAFGSWSDSRLKENIVNLPSQLSNIMALRPVEFDYIQSEGGGHQVGFIAQEIETIYPDSVGERSDGMKTVTGWSKTEARLVKAIQEQQAIIESLKARLDAANL